MDQVNLIIVGSQCMSSMVMNFLGWCNSNVFFFAMLLSRYDCEAQNFREKGQSMSFIAISYFCEQFY